MIEKISLTIVGESGQMLEIEKVTPQQLEIKIETATADLFSEICRRNNAIEDVEIRAAEKFLFASRLNEFLKEMRNELLEAR